MRASSPIMKFSIAGTGNVAYQFAKMFLQHGHVIHQIYARDEVKGNLFAQKFNAKFIADAKEFSIENDLVLLAVNDDAIAEVAALIHADIFTVHASGSTSLEVLIQNRKGVAWPVFSISKSTDLDYSMIPFLIEASDEEGKKFLSNLFQNISSKVFYTTSEQRAKAHIAAVFSNNFVNQMFAIASNILEENDLPFEILLPSIADQLNKIKVLPQSQTQTGPASRGDIKTIEKHLQFLSETPELLQIYTQLTNRILTAYHGKKL